MSATSSLESSSMIENAPAEATPFAASEWIVNSSYDQLFLLLAWLVPFGLTVVAGVTSWPVSFVLFLILDRAHHAATIPLTLLDRESLRSSGRFYWSGLFVLACLAIACTAGGAFTSQIWGSIFVYWGGYHIIRQHYGFLKLYQARSGQHSIFDARNEIICLYSGLAFPYLFEISKGTALIGGGILVVPLPRLIPMMCLGVFLVSSIFVVVASVRRKLRGQTIGFTRLLHIFLAISNFWIGLFLIGQGDLRISLLFITSYHGLQYHAIIRHVSYKRYNREAGTNFLGPLLASTSLVPYLLVVLGVGAIMLLGSGQLVTTDWYAAHPRLGPYAGNLGLAIIYAHILFDGQMWKMRKNPRMRLDLALSRQPS